MNMIKKAKTLLLATLALLFSTVSSLTYAQPLSLTVSDSLRLALAHSPALKAAAAETAKRNWSLEEAQAGQRPTLNVNHQQMQSHPASTTGPANQRATTLEAKTTLYSGGLTEGLMAQASRLQQSAQYGEAYTRQQVMANTYLAYYNVLQAEQNLALATEAVERLSQHLLIVQAQYDEGTVIKGDVLRTEVELAQARQNHSKAQNAHKLANKQMLLLLGLPTDQEIALSATDSAFTYDGSLSDAIQTALQKRSDVKQTQQEEQAAKQGIAVAESGRRPTLSLAVKKEWQNQDYAANPWSTQLTVDFNVFDSGRTHSKIQQADWEHQKARQLVVQKNEQITLETQDAYFNMQNARTALAIASQVVAKAEEDFGIAQVRYQAGLGTNLDVIDSQGALTAAKLNYTNARYDCSKYSIQLAQAMGTLTEEEPHANQETNH